MQKASFLTTRLICGFFYTPDGQITAADILSEPIPKKKRKQDDPKEELREQIKTLKPEEIESVDVSIDSIKKSVCYKWKFPYMYFTFTYRYTCTCILIFLKHHSLYPCRGVYSFRLSFVHLYVCCLFVHTSVLFVEFASKFCVKVSQVVYISATTY